MSNPSPRSFDLFDSLDGDALRRLVHALLRESIERIAVSRRGSFVDFDVRSVGPLGHKIPLRFRLYFDAVETNELTELVAESAVTGLRPIAIAARGFAASASPPNGMAIIRAAELQRLCDESGTVVSQDGTFIVDRDALRELQDNRDPRIALLNGLLWLRPLSRDRIPPALRWTGTPAHELFERCFFLSIVSTFGATGVRWGTSSRGRPVPDGRLSFRGLTPQVLYDCKASRRGYEMTYRDLTGFVDYLNDPVEIDWRPPRRGTLYFLVVSSQFVDPPPSRMFKKRSAALAKKARGAQLVWVRSPDVARFGLAIERANVTHAHRAAISWRAILNAGDVRWSHFERELQKLRRYGYEFDGT